MKYEFIDPARRASLKFNFPAVLTTLDNLDQVIDKHCDIVCDKAYIVKDNGVDIITGGVKQFLDVAERMSEHENYILISEIKLTYLQNLHFDNAEVDQVYRSIFSQLESNTGR